MLITILLIFYFIITMAGLYTAINSRNKEYEIPRNAYSISQWLMIFYLITFSVIYLKHIITSAFILWFIFDVGAGLLLSVIRGYKPVVKVSTLRRGFNVLCGVISGFGVLYILL